MKQKKVLAVMLLSLLAIIVVLVISFLLESKSQKLPAVVNFDKVIVSSDVEGTLKQYAVNSMQNIEAKGLIAEVVNNKLTSKLETLVREKSKFDDLVHSAQKGDVLKTELYALDEDIQKNQLDMEEARLDIVQIRLKLESISVRYSNLKKKYDADKKLFDKGILSTSDFDKSSRDYTSVQNEYNSLKSDSLIASETIKSSKNIISLIQARKSILSSNKDILSSKYQIDLNEVEAGINSLQEEIRSLKIYSPIAGIVTDINFLPGEKVDKGDIVAEIADLNKVWVMAYGNSTSRHKVRAGQKVCIYTGSNKKVWGKVKTLSPVMEKVKSLSSSYETVSTYTKIEISFDDLTQALIHITPGERLFVRIYF